MKIIKVNLEKLNKKVIRETIRVLQKGGLVVYPSHTCYGLTVDVTNRKAIEKIYLFKNRKFDKPISIIVKDETEFKKYGEWSPLVSFFQNKKRPCTYVVDRKNKLSKHLNSKNETIGIQIPKDKLSRELVAHYPYPITATSANIAGKRNVYNIRSLLSQINKFKPEVLPDMILDAGQLIYKKPSRVIRVKGEKYKILRN